MAAAQPDIESTSDVAAPLAATDSAWLAVQVWSGREVLAARHLHHRGYHVFLPCYSERRRWSDRVKVVEHALFPGYLFCRGPSYSAPRIVTSPNVVRIVGNASGPIPIPEN